MWLWRLRNPTISHLQAKGDPFPSLLLLFHPLLLLYTLWSSINHRYRTFSPCSPTSSLCCSLSTMPPLLNSNSSVRLSSGVANTRGLFLVPLGAILVLNMKLHLCAPTIIPHANFHLCTNHIMMTLFFNNVCLFS